MTIYSLNKTKGMDLIREHFENGDTSAVELTYDKECTMQDGQT